MACARDIAVYVARLEHERAEHCSVLGLLCGFLLSHALGLSCFVEYFCVFGSLFRREGIDEGDAREVYFGSNLFALFFIADKNNFGNALFCDFGSGLHHALVLALAEDYRFAEFCGFCLDFIK